MQAIRFLFLASMLLTVLLEIWALYAETKKIKVLFMLPSQLLVHF